jgi:hypothetical protein
MKSLAIFILFVGVVLIIQGYYSNIAFCPKNKTIIKYIPRSLYEEQLTGKENLDTFYKGMFENIHSST